MRVGPFKAGCGVGGEKRAYGGTVPTIRAEQAMLGRGARIHSLGVPAVTAGMSGARINVESSRARSRRPLVL